MKRKARFKRLVIWLLLGTFILPIAGCALSNLFLLSPKGREYIASRIAARIRLETSVQGTTWSPWNGITIHGLRIEQPQELQEEISLPLLAIKSIRLEPVWTQLLRKRLDLKSIDLVEPDFTLPIELLSMIPAIPPEMDRAVVGSPDLAMNQPSAELKTPSPQPPSTIPRVSEQEPTPPEPKTKETKTTPEISTPTRFIDLKDARFRIVTTMSESPLYEVLGLGGKIPFAGTDTKTRLVTGAISTLGNQIADEMEIPLDWRAPALTAGPIDGEVFGFDATAGIQLGLTQGLPLQVIASIPEQRDKEIAFSESTGVKLGLAGGQGVFRGLLLYPGSWQGQAIFRSTGIDAKHLGKESHFDSGHAVFIYRNGALNCADARVNGEETSLLSNATLLSDGRAAANLRVVASPEILTGFARFTDPTGSQPHFTPLHTPQRAALDLQIFGRLGAFRYKPNPEAEPIFLH